MKTDTNPDAVKGLSDDEVAEIEARLDRFLSTLTFGEPARGNRYVESVDADFYFEENADNEYDAFDLLRRFSALCQTVRALRAEKQWLREAVNSVTSESAAMRDQLAQAEGQRNWYEAQCGNLQEEVRVEAARANDLQSQLAQVTQERQICPKCRNEVIDSE